MKWVFIEWGVLFLRKAYHESFQYFCRIAVRFVSVAVSAAPLGEVSSENGKIFSGENYMVVKKDMKKGEQIKPHGNHSGF